LAQGCRRGRCSKSAAIWGTPAIKRSRHASPWPHGLHPKQADPHRAQTLRGPNDAAPPTRQNLCAEVLAGIQLSDRHCRFLWQLEALTVWSARYPVSLSVPKGIRYDEENVPDFVRDPNPNDPELIRQVFSILENELVGSCRA
jgi:hypothetical protein